VKRVIHKIKNAERNGQFWLLNSDGSWNTFCKPGTSDITANWHWQFVTCKACLKFRKLSEVKVADGTPTTNGIPPNNKLSGILPTIL
jgi:hypothetical protein